MKLASLLFASLLAAAPATFAQGKGHHDDPRHGGVAVEAGSVHLEIVAKGQSLTLHVYGHDMKAVDVSAAKAQATVFSGKDKATVDFKPSGPGVMKGEVGFAVRADAKVVLNFTPAKGNAEQARFQLGAKPDHKGHKH